MWGPRPDPLPWFPLVTAKYGVPPVVTTSTASLNLALTDRLNPADLSAAVVIHSNSVMSAEPSEVVNEPMATKTSGVALVLPLPDIVEPASIVQPPDAA